MNNCRLETWVALIAFCLYPAIMDAISVLYFFTLGNPNKPDFSLPCSEPQRVLKLSLLPHGCWHDKHSIAWPHPHLSVSFHLVLIVPWSSLALYSCYLNYSYSLNAKLINIPYMQYSDWFYLWHDRRSLLLHNLIKQSILFFSFLNYACIFLLPHGWLSIGVMACASRIHL